MSKSKSKKRNYYLFLKKRVFLKIYKVSNKNLFSVRFKKNLISLTTKGTNFKKVYHGSNFSSYGSLSQFNKEFLLKNKNTFLNFFFWFLLNKGTKAKLKKRFVLVKERRVKDKIYFKKTFI